MTESFAQLFEESLKEIETRPGSIVRGVVVAIDKDVVPVSYTHLTLPTILLV